jgi:Protein of unknown function (DUF4031)
VTTAHESAAPLTKCDALPRVSGTASAASVAVAVYVDDMRATFGRMIMCHMIADTSEELHAMAEKIGVARRWVQDAGGVHEHYDICLQMRAKAVKLGAKEITTRELVGMTLARYPR